MTEVKVELQVQVIVKNDEVLWWTYGLGEVEILLIKIAKIVKIYKHTHIDNYWYSVNAVFKEYVLSLSVSTAT